MKPGMDSRLRGNDNFEKQFKNGLELGVQYLAIAKSGKSYDVYLFSEGVNPEVEANLKKLGGKYVTKPKEIWGTGEIFGSWTSRPEGLQKFNTFINFYETTFPDRRHYRAISGGGRGSAVTTGSIQKSLFQEIEKSNVARE